MLGPDPFNPKNKVNLNGAEIYFLNVLDTREKEILSDLKNITYHDLEDLVFRMQLTYHEVKDILDPQ